MDTDSYERTMEYLAALKRELLSYENMAEEIRAEIMEIEEELSLDPMYESANGGIQKTHSEKELGLFIAINHKVND